MSDPGFVVRGYRPSRAARSEEDDTGSDIVRLANLERYMLRARAGMPIFEEPGESGLRSVAPGGLATGGGLAS